MAETEQQILTRLGVPSGAKYVLIYDQAAHCDYDWTETFGDYYTTAYPPDIGVKGALEHALGPKLLGGNSSKTKPPYNYYSMCEMDFLRKFVEDLGETAIQKINAACSFFRIVGGGITSPDNLLCSGEGFIRNYLLGKLWLAQTFPQLLPLKHCWIPDDFGHDPELPVVLNALGLMSAAFWRIPGAGTNWNGKLNQALIKQLQTSGTDFFWQASDGSQVFVHWLLMPGYPMGSVPYPPTGPTAAQIVTYLGAYGIGSDPTLNYACTPYLYLPNDNDFQPPNTGLLAALSEWNNSSEYEKTGVFLAQGSFGDFVSLVMFHSQDVKLFEYPEAGLPTFVSQPYWTGYYASQMAMKILHYGATRSMLAAEVFGLLASPGNALNSDFWTSVSQAWNDFAPSTHHDYICGTADGMPGQNIYGDEQLPNLTNASGEASAAAQAALTALTSSVSCSPEAGEAPVLIANPAGAPFEGLVELPAPVPTGMQGLRIGTSVGPVQASYEGGLIFMASAESMGYTTAYLTPTEGSASAVASIGTPDGGATYELTNTVLTVTVAQSAAWGITNIRDSQGNSLLAEGGVGNNLLFYQDAGDIYEFGNEYTGYTGTPGWDSTFAPENPTKIVAGNAVVLESGALRVRLQASITVTTQNGLSPETYLLEYCLVLGEPFLRMQTSGAAPAVSGSPGYSIITAFPLAKPVDAIIHGTACHWTSVQPLPQTADCWPLPIFRATHRFLLPQADGSAQAAIYHPEVPAWAFTGPPQKNGPQIPNGTLIGCLFRNTPGGHHGAQATDTATHLVHYALRTPYGLGDPSTGQPLVEALNYTQPAVAVLIPSSRSGQLPASFSLAGVSQGTGAILAAKPSDVSARTLILRLYQPNVTPQSAQSITVSLGGSMRPEVVAVTALEDPITEGAPSIVATPDGFTITASTALSTVQVTLA